MKFRGTVPSLLEVFVAFDMLRETYRLESRTLASAARREDLSEDACHFVTLIVRRIVRHQVDSRSFDNLAWLVCLRHDFSSCGHSLSSGAHAARDDLASSTTKASGTAELADIVD